MKKGSIFICAISGITFLLSGLAGYAQNDAVSEPSFPQIERNSLDSNDLRDFKDFSYDQGMEIAPFWFLLPSELVTTNRKARVEIEKEWLSTERELDASKFRSILRDLKDQSRQVTIPNSLSKDWPSNNFISRFERPTNTAIIPAPFPKPTTPTNFFTNRNEPSNFGRLRQEIAYSMGSNQQFRAEIEADVRQWLANERELEKLRFAVNKKLLEQTTQFCEIQTSAFESQGRATKVIFYTVHLLLLLGIIASGFEFIHAYRTRKKLGTHHFELSAEKVILKTAMMGVVLLALSLAFYWLYLKFVYPIVTVPL